MMQPNLYVIGHDLWQEYFSHQRSVGFVFHIKKRPSVRTMIRYGMQELVQINDGHVSVHITMSEKQSNDFVSATKIIMHELYHVDQILKGELKFDGMTYIYNGVRYPLKYQFDGSYSKNQKNSLYYRGSRFGVPWESMRNFMDNLADKYIQKHSERKVV